MHSSSDTELPRTANTVYIDGQFYFVTKLFPHATKPNQTPVAVAVGRVRPRTGSGTWPAPCASWCPHTCCSTQVCACY